MGLGPRSFFVEEGGRARNGLGSGSGRRGISIAPNLLEFQLFEQIFNEDLYFIGDSRFSIYFILCIILCSQSVCLS